MLVTCLRLRDFRSYERTDVELGPGLTVVHGRNGAGKTNLLEALYFGLTGRSCRTSNEREVVRFGASTARVEVDLRDEDGHAHAVAVGFSPGEAKRLQADGVLVDRLVDVEMRPLVCVFMPDRRGAQQRHGPVALGHRSRLARDDGSGGALPGALHVGQQRRGRQPLRQRLDGAGQRSGGAALHRTPVPRHAAPVAGAPRRAVMRPPSCRPGRRRPPPPGA